MWPINSRQRIAVALAMVAVVAAAVAVYYWWLGTPQYSIWKMCSAYKKRDYAEFQQYFDVDGIASRAAEQFRSERERDAADTSSAAEKRYWSGRVKQDVIESYRSAFSGSDNSSVRWLDDAAVRDVKRSEKMATVVLDSRVARVTIVMMPISGRRWQVSAVTDVDYKFGGWR